MDHATSESQTGASRYLCIPYSRGHDCTNSAVLWYLVIRNLNDFLCITKPKLFRSSIFEKMCKRIIMTNLSSDAQISDSIILWCGHCRFHRYVAHHKKLLLRVYRLKQHFWKELFQKGQCCTPKLFFISSWFRISVYRGPSSNYFCNAKFTFGLCTL